MLNTLRIFHQIRTCGPKFDHSVRILVGECAWSSIQVVVAALDREAGGRGLW